MTLQVVDNGAARALTPAERSIIAAAVGGSASIPFSTALKFDAEYSMGVRDVTAAVTLTADMTDAIAGRGTLITFIANGSAVVTPPNGSTEAEGSAGYSVASGHRNWLYVWFDGIGLVHQWLRPITQSGSVAPPPVDNTKPTAANATVANSAPSVIALAMAEAMNTGFTPAASAFAVSAGHTVSSAQWTSATVLSITVTPPFTNGETRTLAYTQPGSNGARDVAGNLLDTFTGMVITNNVAAADTTAPLTGTATVANSSPAIIVLTFNEAMNTSDVPDVSTLAVSAGHTVQSLAWSGATLQITVTPAFANGEAARTLSYTPSGTLLRDAANNPLAGFSALAITNNVEAPGSADSDYDTFVANLAAAGGNASTTELNAVKAFMNTARNGAAPFWDLLYRANVFVNDAAGSLVPFKKQTGAPNDLSPASTAVNPGGRGNTSGTGYVNTQTPPPSATGGLSVYLRDIQTSNPAAAKVPIGARNADNTQCFRIVANLDGANASVANAVSGAWGGGNTAQASATQGSPMSVGHWHTHRSSPTSIKTWKNGAIVVAEHTANVNAVPVSEPIYVFCQNGGGTPGAFTNAPTSIGYYAILSGPMTDAQAAAYNNAVVALMTALGRNL